MRRVEFEVLYGGARGGGKTDAGLAWLVRETHNPKLRALILRRNSDDLRDWVDRAYQLYAPMGVIKAGNPPEFRWPSGAIFRTGHLKDDQAYTKYQGHEYHRILIEELTQIEQEKQYLRLLSSCRSTIDITPRVFATTNPGGKGHQWVKKRFVDPAPAGTTIWENNRSRVFIQATMDDNPTLMQKDPMYVANIEALKKDDYETYMAWRFGDWDRFAGQVFSEFNRDHHVIKPIIPKQGTFYLWMDWGYSDHHPTSFSAYISSIIRSKTKDGQGYHQVITFKEFCGNHKDPEEWARIIYKSCNKMGIRPKLGICDPSMIGTRKETGKLPGNLMMDEWKRLHGSNWLQLIKGNNARTGRVGGVAVMHKWLSMPLGLPYWLITESCVNLIRTLPMLIYDEHSVEDVDCFIAGTLIKTIDGDVPIEDIKNGQMILTPLGYKKAFFIGEPKKTKTIKVKLSNEMFLEGTFYHKVFVRGKGLTELQNLKMYDILETWNTSNLKDTNKLFTKALNIADMRVDDIMSRMEHILQRGILHYTGKRGLTLLGIFLKSFIYTIKIIITMIIVLKTWRLFLLKNTLNYTTIREKTSNQVLKNGVTAKKVKKLLDKMHIKCMKEPLIKNYRALIVERLLKRKSQHKNIVMSILEKMGLGKTALFVGKSSGKKIIKKQEKLVHISAVGNLENKEVYRLRVEQAHLYYANGILVANTGMEDHPYDACRYGLMHAKFILVKPGSYKAVRKEKVSYLSTDEHGLPVIDTKMFFNSLN